jgi:hypothetical protein
MGNFGLSLTGSDQRSQANNNMSIQILNPPGWTCGISRPLYRLSNVSNLLASLFSWPQEAGETMFNVVNTYTRAAAMKELPAESSFRLQGVGGEVLGMLN